MRKTLLATIVTLIGTLIIAFLPMWKIETYRIRGLNFTPRNDFITDLKHVKGLYYWQLKLPNRYLENLQRNNPEIKLITTKWQFPHTLLVFIEEKTAWTLLESNNKLHMIAKDGTLLNKRNENAHLDHLSQLILIKGLANIPANSTTIPNDTLIKIKQLTTPILFYFPLMNMQLIYKNDYNITLIKNNTLLIKLGALEFLDLKFQNLIHYLDTYPTQQVNYIDLSVPDKIIVKKS